MLFRILYWARKTTVLSYLTLLRRENFKEFVANLLKVTFCPEIINIEYTIDDSGSIVYCVLKTYFDLR